MNHKITLIPGDGTGRKLFMRLKNALTPLAQILNGRKWRRDFRQSKNMERHCPQKP